MASYNHLDADDMEENAKTGIKMEEAMTRVSQACDKYI